MDLPLVAALFAVLGLFMTALAWPLVKRRIKPNGVYGLRVRATQSDEHVWYEANAASGRDLAGFGLLVAALAVALALIPGIGLEGYTLVMSGVTLGGVSTTAFVGAARARKLLARREQEAAARADAETPDS